MISRQIGSCYYLIYLLFIFKISIDTIVVTIKVIQQLNKSTAQIAAELGITERAAEGRLYRLRQRLRNLLGGDLL